MTEAVSRIFEESQALSTSERGQLIDLMIEQINQAAPEVGPADLAEIHRRMDEVESGAVKMIPAAEVETRIRGILDGVRAAR